MASPCASLAARANILKRHHGADSPEHHDAQRDWAAAKIEDAIQRTLDAAPPLTDHQVTRLAALLRGAK